MLEAINKQRFILDGLIVLMQNNMHLVMVIQDMEDIPIQMIVVEILVSKMSESAVTLLDDFHGGSYGRNIYFDLTLYPHVNPSNFRPGFQGQICYNAYNSGNGGWYSQSIGSFYAEDTDLVEVVA